MNETPQFPGYIKPVHNGVYKTWLVGIGVGIGDQKHRYQHWNGKWWGGYAANIDGAYRNKNFRSEWQQPRWAGRLEVVLPPQELVEHIEWWAASYERDGGHGVVVKLLRDYAAIAGQPAAWRDALAERRRQVEQEGWTPEHDDAHDGGELAAAASAYALAAAAILYPQSQGDGGFTADCPPDAWPPEWAFKPGPPRLMLVKSVALALAEIERYDRATPEVQP